MRALIAALALAALVAALALGLRPREDAPHAAGPAEAADTRAPADVVTPAAPEVERAVLEPAVEDVAADGPDQEDDAQDDGYATLVVRVIASADRAPVRGVWVAAVGPEPTPFRRVDGERGGPGEVPRTGDAGEAVLRVPAGVELTLHAMAGEKSASVSRRVGALMPGEERAVEVEVATGDRPFRGRVVAAEDGAPIAGAELRVTSLSGRSVRGDALTFDSDALPDAVSGPGGEVDLALSVSRSHLVAVTADGRGPAVLLVGNERGTRDARVPIRLGRAGRLVGQVTGAVDARVRLTTEAYRVGQPDGAFVYGATPTWEGAVRADGSFALDGLPAGAPLDAVVLVGGREVLREPTPVVVEPAGEKRVEWHVGGGASIEGIARDTDGRSERNLTVWLLPASEVSGVYLERYWEPARSTLTDAAGRFRFDDVAAGAWVLGPKPEQGEIVSAATHVTVEPGTTAFDVELVVHRGGYLAGVVLDPEGAASANVGVQARGLDGGGWEHDQTDDTGTFQIGPVIPGRYSVVAGAFGRGTAARSDPVEARTGSTDLVLRLTRGGRIEGTVVDADSGEPVPARLVFSDGEGYRSTRTRDGRFQAGALAPGTWHVVASTVDGRAGLVVGLGVAPGTELTDVRVSFAAGARVRVRYDGPLEHAQWNVFLDGLRVAADGVRTGTVATCTVPPGTLVVRLTGWNPSSSEGPAGVRFEHEQTVMAAAGGEVAVDFDVE